MKVNAKPGRNPGFVKLMLSVLVFSAFITNQAQTVSGAVSGETAKALEGVLVSVKGSLEQIGPQYWIASLLNGTEACANFRRAGLPATAQNPYSGKEVSFIYSLTYPNAEQSVNATNFNAAIAGQGPDKLDIKVWVE